MKEMLKDFIDDEFFTNKLTLITKKTTYNQGIAITGVAETLVIEGIIQPISSKELINLGLGNYTDKLNYAVHTAHEITQGENNFIQFKGKTFKIIAAMPWQDYGYNRYVISIFNDITLNNQDLEVAIED
jgi:hypothetical protein